MQTSANSQAQATHTPGPWLEPCTYGASRFEVQGGGRRVAVVDKIDDARLIASAPELLDALVEVTDRLDVFTTSANANTRLAVQAARAAIAKATGGAA